MYEQHFGLTERLFPAKLTGSGVFVGPQTAETMAGIKKALRSRDAVVAVSGPAGSGKSTVVAKALEALGDTFRIVRIGRIRLKGADVLEFLLEQLGVEDVPSGAIRQFSALRAALAQLEVDGVRLVVVVEDATLCGAETISELEALTAADAGESGGAAIVLMGDERLGEFLAGTELARLAQRVRQRHAIKPLTEAEMRGYLLHRFRQAGGDFEACFDKRTAVLVHDLSGGIPRVANSILEAVMTTAAAADLNPVSATAVAAVAKDELGLEVRRPVRAEPAVAEEPAAEEPAAEVPAEESVAEESVAEVPAEESVAEVPAGESVTEVPAEESVAEVRAEEPAAEPDEKPVDDIEAHVENTEPQLPKLEVDEADAVEPVPVASFDATPEIVIESTPEEVPEWEREPTLEELQPDLEALDKAIARAKRETKQTGAEDAPVEEADEKTEDASVDEYPEITLDKAIEQGTTQDVRGKPDAAETPPAKKPDTAAADADRSEKIRGPQKSETANEQLERISAQIEKADTITDIGDTLAERLFGDNINVIAARVAKEDEGHDKKGAQAQSDDDNPASPAQGSANEAATGVPVAPPSEPKASGLDMTAYERLKTVRALNANLRKKAKKPDNDPKPETGAPTGDESSIEPIEDQIDTSMNESLDALNRPPTASGRAKSKDDENGDEDDSGLLGRSRRS